MARRIGYQQPSDRESATRYTNEAGVAMPCDVPPVRAAEEHAPRLFFRTTASQDSHGLPDICRTADASALDAPAERE
jgi:hypothetical protein